MKRLNREAYEILLPIVPAHADDLIVIGEHERLHSSWKRPHTE